MLELGGAQRNTIDTVARLNRDEFEVGLACADHGELLGEARRLTDVVLFPLRHLRREISAVHDLLALRELRGAIRSFAADIVHTHSSKAGILGRAAAKAERVPIVVHSIHGYGFGSHQNLLVRRAFGAVERLAARWTTSFIAVSRENLDSGVRLGLFDAGNAHLIRSGIDLASFRRPVGGEAVRAELSIPVGAPLVVQISCLKPQKAPERFIELASRLKDSLPSAHFLLVGDGELRARLESLRSDRGLDGRVHLPGWRRDVPAVLSAATVVTLTSLFEGLPRALVEALAAGVPVVAMAVDGVVEVVRDGVNGYLVPAADVAGLATRVEEIVRTPSLREELSRRASEGLEEFDRDLMVRQQEQLYRELACRRGLR
jgi:glycosyltransferase involved in cell wall biosynthesis